MGTATIRDVARQAGVSVASASRALNGHRSVTPATRARVADAARALDYVPHLGARSLSTRRSNTLGVVLPDLFGEFFSEIIRGIDYAAHRRGLQILLSNMHGNPEETTAAIRAMRGRVDGLLVLSAQLDAAALADALPRGLPAVVLGSRVGGPRHASIVIDNREGARAAVAHLVAQGCRRIAHIAGPRDNADAIERARGFREAVAELLGDRDPRILAGDFGERAGADAARAIAADRAIDGVFSANDIMAIGCMVGLVAEGIAVPREVAIVGFDDIPIARYVTPALSTMGLGIAALGERAVERLIDAIEQPDGEAPEPERLVPHLIVRGSSARDETGGAPHR